MLVEGKPVGTKVRVITVGKKRRVHRFYSQQISDEYTVTQKWVETVLQTLRCPTPSVDAFANAQNHRFPRWWGEGGESPDAFAKNWGEESLISECNPLFKLLSQVVTKAIADQADMVLICPNWPRPKWWQMVQKHVHVGHLVPEGTRMFELNGKIPGPTHWDTWTYWLKGTCPQPNPTAYVRPVEEYNKKKKSQYPQGQMR